MIYLIYIIVIILCLPLIIMPFNRFIKSSWPCRFFGWHLTPHNINIKGINYIGKCPRCNKEVMQDSQGNWF